jgi:hypothetical protein
VPGSEAEARVMLVDVHGVPVQGGVLTPEEEYPPATPRIYQQDELLARSSDAAGLIHFSLEDCFWKSDECYHIRVHRAGFDDVTMAVSRDLFPPLLRVELRVKGQLQLPGQELH